MLTIRPALPEEVDVLRAIDDDATALYAEHGLHIEFGPDHEFVRSELARWRRSAEQGRAFLALDDAGIPVAFAALDIVDGQPYLDQLAVRTTAMRRGIGGRLLTHSVEWARAQGGSALWLTMYDHVPFNRPYYERHGYRVVADVECGPGIRHHLAEQRRHLPAPTHRVAMCLRCGARSPTGSGSQCPLGIDMRSACAHAGRMSRMVQVRNVPDALHRKLKTRAADEGQTLSDYLLAELARLAARPTREEMLARLHSRKRVTLTTPAADVIREERESA